MYKREVRFIAKSEDLRDLIAEKAFELFIDNSIESVSLNEIVRQSGHSKGAFYHHFKSKDDLLEYILCSINAKMNKNKDKFTFEYDNNLEEAIEKIVGFTLLHINYIDVYSKKFTLPILYRFYLDAIKFSNSYRELSVSLRQFIVESYTKLFETAIKNQEISNKLSASEYAEHLSLLITGSFTNLLFVEDINEFKGKVKRDVKNYIKLIKGE